MVSQFNEEKMKLSDTENVMGNKGDSSSSDEGNSAMISDGDRSGDSSPPSAVDMSLVLEEGSPQETSASQAQQESRQESPLDILLPADPFVALAAMLPSVEIRGPAAMDSSSSEQEKPSAKAKANADEQSPLSYKSLEERSSSTASTSHHEKAKTGEQPLIAPTHDSDIVHLTLKEAVPSLEAAGVPLKMITMKGSPKQGTFKAQQGAALRRGKWTVEEEAYVARVIQDFNSGFLNAPAGTTLRTYLSEKLKCDPMRITKKFTGDACIGKRVFHPAVRNSSNAAAIDKAQAELDTLERRWRRRLEMQQRESAKKAAASAAVAAAASSGRALVPSSDKTTEGAQPNPVAQTAAWLDRAKSALKEPPEETPEESIDLHNQMQEVQRLIHEGPVIQRTSADLPQMLDEETQAAVGEAGEVEPADKRMRTAEDAEALVGFLRRVRASAASGEEF